MRKPSVQVEYVMNKFVLIVERADTSGEASVNYIFVFRLCLERFLAAYIMISVYVVIFKHYER